MSLDFFFRKLAINIANTFPNIKYLSLLFNPCCDVMEGEEYERQRMVLIYKLPSLRFLDHKMITPEEKQMAEKSAGGMVSSSPSKKSKPAKKWSKKKDKEDQSFDGDDSDAASDDDDDLVGLKQDAQQAEIIRQAKKDAAKKRSVSTSSIRKMAGLADTSASGLVKASGRKSGEIVEEDGEDSSYLMGNSDDSSEAPAMLDGSKKKKEATKVDDSLMVEVNGKRNSVENGSTDEKKSTNFPMVRSVSLSGRKLEDHFEYKKKQPKGKLVDLEGWLNIRLSKVKKERKERKEGEN